LFNQPAFLKLTQEKPGPKGFRLKKLFCRPNAFAVIQQLQQNTEQRNTTLNADIPNGLDVKAMQ